MNHQYSTIKDWTCPLLRKKTWISELNKTIEHVEDLISIEDRPNHINFLKNELDHYQNRLISIRLEF